GRVPDKKPGKPRQEPAAGSGDRRPGLRRGSGAEGRRGELHSGRGEHPARAWSLEPHAHQERRRRLRHPRREPALAARRERGGRRGRLVDAPLGTDLAGNDLRVRPDPGWCGRQPARPPDGRRGHRLRPLLFLVHLQRGRHRHNRRRRPLAALGPAARGGRAVVQRSPRRPNFLAL
ncbi:MAG: Lipoprotein signal peptidase, partial [uncultured Rubrobacteraceae bacterium]